MLCLCYIVRLLGDCDRFDWIVDDNSRNNICRLGDELHRNAMSRMHALLLSMRRQMSS